MVTLKDSVLQNVNIIMLIITLTVTSYTYTKVTVTLTDKKSGGRGEIHYLTNPKADTLILIIIYKQPDIITK